MVIYPCLGVGGSVFAFTALLAHSVFDCQNGSLMNMGTCEGSQHTVSQCRPLAAEHFEGADVSSLQMKCQVTCQIGCVE